jgi:hypothetical protein
METGVEAWRCHREVSGRGRGDPGQSHSAGSSLHYGDFLGCPVP